MTTKYCTACGEDVPMNTLTREGKIERTCVYCGFVLDVSEPAAPRDAIADCIMTADDAEFTRELLRGMLLKRKLCRAVVAAANGQEFLAGFTKRLTEGRDTDLVILDLEMPVMDGITAARVLRALEGKHGVGKVPILFFSARKCDDALKQQLALLAPASYVNKGNEADPEKLVERIDQLVTYLLSKRQSAGRPAQAGPVP